MKRTLLVCFLSAVAGGVVAAWIADSRTNWIGEQTAHAQLTAPAPAISSPLASNTQFAPPPSQAMPSNLTPEEITNIRVYDIANRGVVNINTKFDSYERVFMMMVPTPGQGSGSGAVIDNQGHILTNFHVVEDADDIQVTLSGGKIYPAKLVGHDAEHDIAILKVDAPSEELYPIAFGSSENLRVGQRVYALGNPFGLEGTITTGIISNLNRTLPSRVPDRELKSIIQTDAALNPGNSGGPLLDTSGRMIGMNVAIATKSGQSAGLGFALPVNRIARFVPELIATGKITRPDIGIVAVKETERGLQILMTNKGGPAEQAGLRGWRIVRQQVRRGPFMQTQEKKDPSHADHILAVDGHRVESGNSLIEAIESHKPGDRIVLTILREGREEQVPVTLGAT
jgi:S1-C subfamily serine protease